MKYIKQFLISTVLLVLFSVSAVASYDLSYESHVVRMVKCIQNQMRGTGYYDGLIDGVISDSLIDRYDEYQKKHGLAKVALSNNTAVVICRTIGENDESLQDYWPSKNNEITIVEKTSIPPSILKTVNIDLSYVNKSMSSRFNYHIPDLVHILFSTSLYNLKETLKENLANKKTYDEIIKAYKAQCNNSGKLHGMAYNGIILVCFPAEWNKIGYIPSRENTILKDIIIHEYIHSYQYQYLGYDSFEDGEIEMGPIWLREGPALYASLILQGPDKVKERFRSIESGLDRLSDIRLSAYNVSILSASLMDCDLGLDGPLGIYRDSPIYGGISNSFYYHMDASEEDYIENALVNKNILKPCSDQNP